MGNASPSTHANTSGSWFSYLGDSTSSADRLPVVLKLIDARNVQLRAWEELYGIVRVGSDNIARVRQGSPAQFPVESATILTLEFQATRGCGSELADARVVGEVRLSMQHVASRCGRCLYHLWLPLRPPHSQRSPSPENSDDSPSSSSSLRHFDHAVASAAREPRWAMVCLSMTQAGSPESAADLYEHSPAEARVRRFSGLMQSHAQHARMLQALYRHVRKSRRPDQLGNTAQHNFRGGSLVEHSLAGMPVGAMGSVGSAMDISRLQEEIASTTSEANTRITQAAEAVHTLEERLAARKSEHDKLREEASRMEHDSEAMALESERMSLQLERRARERSGKADPEETEAEQLRREASVLKEQKDALMLILEDLYGAGGDRESEGQSASMGSPAHAASAPDAAGDDLASASFMSQAQPDVQEIERLAPHAPAFVGSAGGGQAWENLLPRPSELFAEEGIRLSFR